MLHLLLPNYLWAEELQATVASFLQVWTDLPVRKDMSQSELTARKMITYYYHYCNCCYCHCCYCYCYYCFYYCHY